MSNTTGNPLGYPCNPIEGEIHEYIDPISGCQWVTMKFIGYQNGKARWKHIKTE